MLSFLASVETCARRDGQANVRTPPHHAGRGRARKPTSRNRLSILACIAEEDAAAADGVSELCERLKRGAATEAVTVTVFAGAGAGAGASPLLLITMATCASKSTERPT